MKYKNLPSISIASIMIIMTLISSNLQWGKENWRGVLESDAKGYYAYLPAVFIYKDLNFNFFDKIEKEKYYNEKLFFEYRAHVNDTTVDKFYCGTAIAQLPFFLTAHVLSGVVGFEQDGYSKLYMIFICLAALFYLFTGLFYLNKILIQYNVLPVARSLTLITTVFATNIFYYTVVEAGMSHIYSFGFVTMFLYFVKSYFLKKQDYKILISAALFGLIILLRPINGLVILTIPFLSGSSKSLLDGLSNLVSKPKLVIFSSIIILLLLSIQPVIYKIAVNRFFVYSYEYEKFNFNDPHIFDILFSYKKGLFLYSPVLFISLAGGIYLFKRNRFEFYSLFLFLTILTYMLSSWWNWWYGGSFSSRVYLEYIPIFTLLLGITISSLPKGIAKTSFFSLVFACILLCQIQTYQYRYYQIHWENMTKEKYWEVFLRIDKLI